MRVIDRPDEVHHENRPALDLDAVRRRVRERRAAAPLASSPLRDVVEADTDMIEALACEVARLSGANEGLRAVLREMRRP